MLTDRSWYKADGATDHAIQALVDEAPFVLPPAYLDLLRFSNGGEGPLSVQPLWLNLFPAEEALTIIRHGAVEQNLPGLFVFGDSGGGETFAIDGRVAGAYPVVAMEMAGSEVRLRPVAADFDALLELIEAL